MYSYMHAHAMKHLLYTCVVQICSRRVRAVQSDRSRTEATRDTCSVYIKASLC